MASLLIGKIRSQVYLPRESLETSEAFNRAVRCVESDISYVHFVAPTLCLVGMIIASTLAGVII